jgi:hypothetical protein
MKLGDLTPRTVTGWRSREAAQARRNHVEDALRRARLRRAAKPGAARSGLKL